MKKLVLLLVLAATVGNASAYEYIFSNAWGTGDGSWHDANNWARDFGGSWLPDQVPGEFDYAYVRQNYHAYVTSAAIANLIRVGLWGSSGELTVNGGTLRAKNQYGAGTPDEYGNPYTFGDGHLEIGLEAGVTGVMTVNSGRVDVDYNLLIGNSGTLNVYGGEVYAGLGVTGGPDWAGGIVFNNAANGRINMYGGTLHTIFINYWTNAGTIYFDNADGKIIVNTAWALNPGQALANMLAAGRITAAEGYQVVAELNGSNQIEIYAVVEVVPPCEPVDHQQKQWYFPLDDPKQTLSYNNTNSITRNQTGPGYAVISNRYQTWKAGMPIPDAWNAAGKFGGCLDGRPGVNYTFDPAFAKVKDAHFPAMTAMTIAFWAKMDTSFTDSSMVLQAKGSIGNETVKLHLDYWDRPLGEGGPSLATFNYAGGQRKFDRAPLYDGNWHHVVLVADLTRSDADQGKIYIDGAAVDSNTYGSITSMAPTLTMTELQFCGTDNDLSGRYFGGWMDEFRVYNYAFSPSDVTSLYNLVPAASTQAQWDGPRSGSKEVNGPKSSSNWNLTWKQGNGGGSSYDVLLGMAQDTDYNGDGVVNLADLEMFIQCWLADSWCLPEFAAIADQWLKPAASLLGNTAGLTWGTGSLVEGERYFWQVNKKSPDIAGQTWFFDAVPRWKLTEFPIMLGWAGLERLSGSDSRRAAYVADLVEFGLNLVPQPHAGQGYKYFNELNAAGLKAMIYENFSAGTDDHEHTPASFVDAYKDHPAIWGYFMDDEAPSGQESFYGQKFRENHWADPTKPSYQNLYSSDIGYSQFVNYVNAYTSNCNMEVLSYDHYPYRYGISEHWDSLEFMRSKSLELSIPLIKWEDVQQGSSYPGPTANKNRARWCVYSSLAYGVKGIFWYSAGRCYTFTGNTDFARSSAWYDIKDVNAELRKLGTQVINLTSTAVYHTNSSGSSHTTTLPAGNWVQVANSDSGFVLGMFSHPSNGLHYAMVANKSDSATISNKQVTFKDAVTLVRVFNEQTDAWDTLTVQGTYPNQYVQITMGPGYGKLLEITKQ